MLEVRIRIGSLVAGPVERAAHQVFGQLFLFDHLDHAIDKRKFLGSSRLKPGLQYLL